MEINYKTEIKRVEAIINDTYFACVYIPCHHDFDKKKGGRSHASEAVIVHP